MHGCHWTLCLDHRQSRCARPPAKYSQPVHLLRAVVFGWRQSQGELVAADAPPLLSLPHSLPASPVLAAFTLLRLCRPRLLLSFPSHSSTHDFRHGQPHARIRGVGIALFRNVFWEHLARGVHRAEDVVRHRLPEARRDHPSVTARCRPVIKSNDDNLPPLNT